MTSEGFRLTRLTLKGPSKPDAEVRFAPGLNVVVGASNTGKTYVAECVDFMLGGRKSPKNIPQAAGYDSLQLGIIMGEEESVLERSLTGGAFRLVRPDGETRPLGAKHQHGKDDTVSHQLLLASGLAGKRIRQNQRGETRDLSFRDVARLILVDETAIIADRSPIYSGTPQFKGQEQAVFRLFLTGVDDSSVVALEDPKIAKGRQAGKTELVKEMLEKAQAAVAERGESRPIEDLRKEIDLATRAAASAEQALNEHQTSASSLENERRSAWQRLREADSRLTVLSELQKRFALLEEQYNSDLRRLEAVSEASSRLGEMQEVRCPICGALAEHHDAEHQEEEASLEEVLNASAAEAERIRALLRDLHETRTANEAEIRTLGETRDESHRALEEAGRMLSATLRPRVQEAVQEHRARQEELQRAQRTLEHVTRVRELESLLAEVDVAPKRETAEGPSTAVGADQAEDFCQRVEEMLRSWCFPGLDRVTFSEEDQDIVITGQRRASHGKGVRAITHAAFNLALMKHCQEQDMPHPNMVLLDSPLIVYKQPDAGEEAFTADVKDAFYRSVATEFSAAQVIVMENDPPPEDLRASIHVTEFTGTGEGRSGLFPSQSEGQSGTA